MSNRRLSGSIALSKLIHVPFEMTGKSGKKVKGIFIPIENNHFVEGKEGALYMNVNVVIKVEADQYGQHGFISQSVDSKKYKAATDAEKEAFKKLPILGNLKDFEASSNDNIGAASQQTFTPESDDLPF